MEGNSGNCVGGPEPCKHSLWASLMDYPISGYESPFSNVELQSVPLEASLLGFQGRNMCYQPWAAVPCCVAYLSFVFQQQRQHSLCDSPRGLNESMALR